MNRPILFILLASAFAVSCSNNDSNDWTESLSAFTLSDDQVFGEKIDEAIMADSENFNVLNEESNKEAYEYATTVMNTVLGSSLINYKDSFDWKIRIIDDTTLNAFAAPGGKLYFYKGFINYLENGAQFAGVMAHLIAHIDQRQMSQLLSDAYGENTILALLENTSSNITYNELALDLAANKPELEFSQTDEFKADEYALRYLNDIKSTKDYDCKGIVGFLEKIQSDNYTAESFGFIASHVVDAGRLQNIEDIWEELGEPTGNAYEIEFLDFKTYIGLKSKEVIFNNTFDSDTDLILKAAYDESEDTAFAVINDSKIQLFASGNGKAEVFISIDTIKVDSVYLEIGFDKFTSQYYPWPGEDIAPVVSSHFAFNFNNKYLGINSSIDDLVLNESVVEIIYHNSSNELTVMDGNTNVSDYFLIENVATSLEYTSIYFNATSQQISDETTQCETIIDYIKIYTYK